MTKWLSIFLHSLISSFRTRRDLAFENLLLRQQLAVMKQVGSRPRLSNADRRFWVLASRIWPGWRDALHIVRPDTVVRWHRDRFRRYCARKSRCRGRPKIDFLENHARDIIAVDFLTVPTATFRVLFVLVILSHDRRKILHTNAAEHPTAIWTARQLIEAIGTDDVPTYLLHDRGAIFGAVFKRQAASAGLREVITAPRSPWQNPYAERVIGSIRRECLDHTIVLGERHLRRAIGNYVRYYNKARTHLSLEKDAPAMRAVHPANLGPIVSKDHCGGLHHEYLRAAA